jgi:pimeloyl-ACP methyl ester carboxylesterase
MAEVVLVHGAWHGAWCWDKVVAELDRREVANTAVELPLSGFEDDVAAARAVIEAAGPGAVVCGHSYGGLVISAAAYGATEVARLVYLAALMSEQGEDLGDLLGADSSGLMDALVFDEKGYMTVEPTRIHEIFYADSSAEEAGRCAALLRPMPAGAISAHAAPPAWLSIPSTYVVCANDQAIPPPSQRRMALRATSTVEWPCDHSPFLTRPGPIATLLQEALAQ